MQGVPSERRSEGRATADGALRATGAALVSAAIVTLSVCAMFAGFSAAWDVAFTVFASLTTLWALGLGIRLLRKSRPMRQTRAGDET